MYGVPAKRWRSDWPRQRNVASSRPAGATWTTDDEKGSGGGGAEWPDEWMSIGFGVGCAGGGERAGSPQQLSHRGHEAALVQVPHAQRAVLGGGVQVAHVAEDLVRTATVHRGRGGGHGVDGLDAPGAEQRGGR